MNQKEFDDLPTEVRLKHYAKYMEENKSWMWDVVFLAALMKDKKWLITNER